DLDDLRQAETTTYLDELAARNDDLSTVREGPDGQDRGRRVVVDHSRGLGAGQAGQEGLDPVGPLAPLAAFEVEFEVAVAPNDPVDRLDGFIGERGSAEPGVEQD